MNLTALIWMPVVGEWLYVEDGQPVALYRHAYDFANKIPIAGPDQNTHKWKLALEAIGGEEVWRL